MEGDGDLAGKVFLVTGATGGIGLASAHAFARRGATLKIVARSREKGEKVLAELKARSGNPTIELLTGDLSVLGGARSVAESFRHGADRLDVLVNNAGAMFDRYVLTPDGFEVTFALNHLGYFLLTRELMDLVEKTPGARVVSTSSGAHRVGRLKLDTIANRPSKTAGFAAYGDSKLANILFTRELVRRLAPSGAIANCFHPGFVRTGFAQAGSGFVSTVVKLSVPVVGRTPEKGAETLVWLATSPEAASFSGQYFFDKKVAHTTRRAKNDDLARQLWDLSERLCG